MENNVIEVKFKEQKECLPLVFKSVGPAGPQGVAGKSAYEQAVEAGYTGTEEEFNSLVFNAKNYAEEAKEAAEDVNNAINQHNSSDSAHPDIRENLSRKQDDDDFHPEDYGWPDIRPAARPNAIVLLAGVASDYSSYDNLGFIATCEGGYNVFIDGVQYGTTYASGAQCSITWSQYSATAGFSITQPEALTAHIVQIVPATADNNITAFKCVRVATSGQETQGVLWVHFNLQNAVTIRALLQDYASLYCPLCKADVCGPGRPTIWSNPIPCGIWPIGRWMWAGVWAPTCGTRWISGWCGPG